MVYWEGTLQAGFPRDFNGFSPRKKQIQLFRKLGQAASQICMFLINHLMPHHHRISQSRMAPEQNTVWMCVDVCFIQCISYTYNYVYIRI